jgi:hypothetical protein
MPLTVTENRWTMERIALFSYLLSAACQTLFINRIVPNAFHQPHHQRLASTASCRLSTLGINRMIINSCHQPHRADYQRFSSSFLQWRYESRGPLSGAKSTLAYTKRTLEGTSAYKLRTRGGGESGKVGVPFLIRATQLDSGSCLRSRPRSYAPYARILRTSSHDSTEISDILDRYEMMIDGKLNSNINIALTVGNT